MGLEGMPQDLSGCLALLSVPEITQWLAHGRKTGRLCLAQERETGELCFRVGEIVAVHCAHRQGEQAFLHMVWWRAGTFRFYAEEPTRQAVPEGGAERLSRLVHACLRRIRSIQAVIPSAQTVFRVIEPLPGGQAQLQPNDLLLLKHVDGTNSILDILRCTGWTELEVYSRMFRCHQLGLLEKSGTSAASPGENVAAALVDQVSHELTKYLGPIAPLLVDESLDAWGFSRERFPAAAVGELLERIGREIADEHLRTRFLKTGIELLMGERVAHVLRT
jgi:hypothetical protein